MAKAAPGRYADTGGQSPPHAGARAARKPTLKVGVKTLSVHQHTVDPEMIFERLFGGKLETNDFGVRKLSAGA